MSDRSVVLFAALVVIVAPLAVAMVEMKRDSNYLGYDDFVRAVEAGHVKSVALDHYSRITGTQTVDGVDQPFSCYASTGAANDPLLLRLLNSQQVKVTLNDKRDADRAFDVSCP